MAAQKCQLRLGSKMSERSDTPILFPAPLREEPPKSEAPEKRAQVRYPFTAAAEIYELRSQTRVAGRCSDHGRRRTLRRYAFSFRSGRRGENPHEARHARI